MRFLFVFIASCICATALGRALVERNGALLIFERSLSGPLVAGLNVSVGYTVHNVGSGAALRVQLRDGSFPASRFDGIGGALRHTWSSIKPGESGDLSVTVSPRRAGILYVSPPAITYRDAGASRVSRLAVEDTLVVEDLAVYTRRTASHKAEWAAYAALFLLLVGMPAALYSQRRPTPDSSIPPGKKQG